LEGDLVTEAEFTIRFLVSLIESVEIALLEYTLLGDKRPSTLRKFSFLVRPGGLAVHP
jgi:hypothetical protein